MFVSKDAEKNTRYGQKEKRHVFAKTATIEMRKGRVCLEGELTENVESQNIECRISKLGLTENVEY